MQIRRFIYVLDELDLEHIRVMNESLTYIHQKHKCSNWVDQKERFATRPLTTAVTVKGRSYA